MHSLDEAGLVLRVIVISELDLALDAGKLQRLIGADRVRALQDGVAGLKGAEASGVKRCICTGDTRAY
jgi:hypothetical protein